MALLPNGQYRIFNTAFATQDADLLGGGPAALVGGYVNNTNTFNMVWNLNNAGNRLNQFTLTSAAPSAHGAHVSPDQSAVTVGTYIHGSSNPAIWTLVPTPHPGQYWILAPMTVNSSIPSGLVWSLDSNVDGYPITLAKIVSDDDSQLWTFHPQGGNVGNVVGGLDDLD